MRARLAHVQAGEAMAFEHVFPAARATLAAVLAREAGRRTWIVCETQSAQEALHNELTHWLPEALFYPEQDIAPVEGAIPDPENMAERLAVLHKLAANQPRKTGGKKSKAAPAAADSATAVVVLTRASLRETVPTPESFGQLETVVRRGQTLDREALLRELADAGYEHVAQVSQRGQFAVRGGILDVYSFHHALPARIELFGDEIDSLRHFDLDAQTSVQQVDSIALLLGDAANAKRTCSLADLIQPQDLTIDAGGLWLAAQVRFLEGAESTDLADGTVDDTDEETADATDGDTATAAVLSESSATLSLIHI